MVEIVENRWHDWWVVADGRVVDVVLCSDGDGPGAMSRALDRAEGYCASGQDLSILTHGTDWRSMAYEHVRRPPSGSPVAHY
jgi:DNA primase